MKKLDFYIDALKAGVYRKKDWVISAFSVTEDPDPPPAEHAVSMTDGVSNTVVGPHLYSIRHRTHSTEVYVPTSAGNEWVEISDCVPYTPLFYPGDPLQVTPEMIPNCKEPVDSTYGDLLFNWIVLVEPFGSRIDYQVGPVKIGSIERMIAKRLVDDPEISGVEPTDDQIPVKMYMRFGRCVGALAGYTQLFVPTFSAKALQTDPAVKARRTELLEENADRLRDPVVVAKIQNELIAMDKAWLQDDPSEGFLLSNKTWGTARKRMFLIHGPEAGFDEGGNAELVVNSLEEGWDTTKLVAMFNSARAGSYYRGALTALGGEAVKFFMRVFQNVNISVDDCGSKLGKYRQIEKGQGAYYAGLWEITPNGPVLLDEARAIAMEGKSILTRSPQYCKVSSTDFCAKCVGAALAAIGNAIGAESVSVASQFMDIMMASAHAKELKTARLDLKTAFT